MSTVLAAYNIKGGVGKTTTAVNLAYLSALEGARTLVWDLDPQGAASFYFRIKPKVKGGSQRLVTRKNSLDRLIKGTDFDNLDLLPADFSYRNLDLLLDRFKRPTQRLYKLLKPLLNDYDYVFVDCAPGISLVSEGVFETADTLLVPMIPTTLSLRTFDQLRKFLKKNRLTDVKLLPFFSMVDRRKHLHRQIVDAFTKRNTGILKSAIPNSSEVEKMGVHRAPLGSFAAHSHSARAYENLWQNIKQHLVE